MIRSRRKRKRIAEGNKKDLCRRLSYLARNSKLFKQKSIRDSISSRYNDAWVNLSDK